MNVAGARSKLKTRHSYHDAVIRAEFYGAGDDIIFEVELCGCSGSPGATIRLSFYGIQNIGEVRQFIAALSGRAKGQARIAEIIGLAREADRRILIDLDHRPLYIKAKGFTET